jgi:lysophospholipase L1-like esterase
MSNPAPKISKLREWRNRFILLSVSLLISLLLAEVLTRIFFPISDRRDNITPDGKTIESFLAPGTVYRQVSNEYDAQTTITDKGYRAPAVAGSPDLVFLGDSFTFGMGLSDAEAFPGIYCARYGLSCANLGMPGSGTLRQVERLEQFIEQHQWRPKEVRLFFFGMSGSFSAGNDFVDNYDRARNLEAKQQGEPEAKGEQTRGFTERVIGLQAVLLRHSNLVRMLKFYAGPRLKAMFIAEPGEDRMLKAVEATRSSLQRLDELSRRAGFEYDIYLLVPVHDVMRGTHGDTLATLQAVSPKPVIPTAELFLDSPTQYYFAFDGHFNAKGSRLIADFLVSRDENEKNTPVN